MPSFTLNASPNGLVIEAWINHPLDNAADPNRIKAIIDTGATSTMIGDDIAQSLQLPLLDVIPINSVESTNFHPVYLAGMRIPISATQVYDLKWVRVIGGLSPKAGQCLIGMDILRHGLLFYNGRTNSFTVSF